MNEGTVVAVSLSDKGGVPKYTQEMIIVGRFGVDGDYHATELRTNKNGETAPNHRHVTVVAAEALDSVAEALGVIIPPGGLGENILVRGLGDLGQVQPGERLRFSSGVELEVTEQNNPCGQLAVYHPQAPKELYGKRGLLTVVKTPGSVQPGDTVEVA